MKLSSFLRLKLPFVYKFLENLRELYKDIKDWSWLILVGLIHDLGKVLVLEEFGKFDEWFSVGDIYPLGCAFHKSNIFYEKNYHKKCIDYNNSQYNTSGFRICNSNVSVQQGSDPLIFNAIVFGD